MPNASIHAATVTNFIDRLPAAFRERDADADNKLNEGTNVQRLRDMYLAMVRGDFEPVFAMAAEDMEMNFMGPPEFPLAGQWRGRQACFDAMGRNFGLLEDQQAELLTLLAQGDDVCLFAREQGRFRPTGKPYDMHWMEIFTFRNGQIVRLQGLFDTAALMSAARPG